MSEEKPCKFCESLAWWKENSPKGKDGLYTTFQVSLITKTHRKGAGVFRIYDGSKQIGGASKLSDAKAFVEIWRKKKR